MREAVHQAVHLHTRSGFSWGSGTATPEELAERADALGFGALALTDRDGLHGVPRFLAACEGASVSPIVGAEVTVEVRVGPSGTRGHLVLLCESLVGYRNLSRLISLYRTRPAPLDPGREPSAKERRSPAATLEDVCSHAEGLVCLTGAVPFGLVPSLLLSPRTGLRGKAEEALSLLRGAFGADGLFAALTDDGTHGSRRRMRLVEAFAEARGVPTVAAHEVSYLGPRDHRLHEVLRSASALSALPPPGYRPTDRLYLRSPAELARLFADRPGALRRNAEVAERCAGAVRMGTPEWGGKVLLPEAKNFPRSPVSGGGRSPEEGRLLELVVAGARKRYGAAFRGEPDAFPNLAELKGRLRKELGVILSMGMGGYFLIAHEAVGIARELGVPVTGRGSAGNSVVAHCLFLTAPEPFRHRLVFERFLHPGRADPPDVDLDFASGPSGRDAVRAEMMRRYAEPGGPGAAVAANFDTYSLRGGIRAAARALGYSPAETNALAKGVPRHPLRERDQTRPLWDEVLALPEMRGSPLRSAAAAPPTERHRVSLLMNLSERLEGRLKGPGTHLGGLVFGTPEHRLSGIVPLEHSGTEGLPRVQWDRDSLELAGLPKLDLLGLRTHSALRDAGVSVGKKLGRRMDPLCPPKDDRETYRMIRAARTISCFQVESPGQQALQRRLGARSMDDLVHAISLHRPGPIRADMVTPYVMRRNGLEAYSVPLPHLLDDVLRPTFGLLLFQESVMEVVHRVAGYSLGEADGFRRAMTKDRGPGAMAHLKGDFLRRSAARGVPRRDAELVFGWVEGFSVYGFPKAHAAAFAETAYATAYMLRHHPAEWLAAVLANQPMGFFSPRVLVNEARRRGLSVLPPDLRSSGLAFEPEDGGRAIRVGLSYCRGVGDAPESVLEERERRPFASVSDLYRRTPLGRDAISNVVRAGFLDHLGSRAGLLAEASRLPKKMRRGPAGGRQPELPIPEGSHPSSWWEAREGVSEIPGAALLRDREAEERRLLRLDLRGHPLDAPEHREALAALGVSPASEVLRMPHGRRARVAGLLECLQSPPTKSGRPVWFVEVEDASGLLQATFFRDTYERFGPVLHETSAYLVDGRVERDPRRGFAFLADRISDLAGALAAARKGAVRPLARRGGRRAGRAV